LRRAPPPTLFPYTTLFRSDPDVDLDPLEDPKGRQALVQRVDLDVLVGQRAAGMVGDRQVLIATVARGTCHLLERVLPVRPGRMGDRKSTRLNSSHVSISYA